MKRNAGQGRARVGEVRSGACKAPGVQGGFALIATISVMVLLVMIALAMLSLSTVTMRSSQGSSAQAEAQSNARLALMLAIGDLQKYAGRDQRVTGTGSLMGESVQHPHWTGVWSTTEDESLPVWLVSGNDALQVDDLDGLVTHPASYFTPDAGVGQDSTILFSGGGNDPTAEVRVPSVTLKGSSTTAGRYAWWVSDEGTKARVDVQASAADPVNNYDRIARMRLAQENNISALDPKFEPLNARDRTVDKRLIISTSSLEIPLEDPTIANDYHHDLTTGGYGLPVNVVQGVMKTDLSITFDSSQAGSKFAEELMGARPVARILDNATIYDFSSVRDRKKFFLSSELSEEGRLPVGPNWGILYNYAQLWKNTSSGSTPITVMNPGPRTDLRTNNWPPYRNVRLGGAWKQDVQHTSSSVTPIVSMLQMGFRLSTKEVPAPSGADDPDGKYYQVQLQMKPVLGVWNPYNIKINAAPYRIDWALYPYLRIGVRTPDGKEYNPRIWMRENWLKGSGSATKKEKLNLWFNLTTDGVDLEPGEIRLFSVGTKTVMSKGVNKLVPTWSEEGAFTHDLVYSSDEEDVVAGQKIIVPADSKVWYEDLFIEDTQHPETITRYTETYLDGRSASWFTFKVGSTVTVTRISDIWQTPTNAEREGLDFSVPDQVNSDGVKRSVESLAVTPSHVGTWRWSARNCTEAQGSQSLRGWADTNPRFAATNPVWDGSKPNGSSYEGWHFISPFIGASYEDSNDGGPPGRGKAAEGDNEFRAFPQATNDGGRYRGFGGLSSNSSGQSHVAIYDVPRSPLVSLGQFQHAQLSRYGYEPGFPFANSYANPRIPLDQTSVKNFTGMSDFTMMDLSYVMNEQLWDDYFFSTIGKDYFGPSSTGTLDGVLPFAEVVAGTRLLPNPRYALRPLGDDSSFQGILEQAEELGSNGSRALSARIAIDGAFNVNSASKEAWKAILSSMADFEFPSVSRDGSSTSWEKPTGIRFPKFGHVVTAPGWEPAEGPLSPNFWLGYRRLSESELDKLATEIVDEVRLRGPFRSFAEFVNRKPSSSDYRFQRKGALQAALDRAINSDLGGDFGKPATTPAGELFSEAFGNESQAAGFAGYLMQGDVLQSLAPIMQVRSDYFRVRASGQATDAQGRVLATAVCEAFVQREASFIDPEDAPESRADELNSEANKKFGRRFKIVSFRWLSAAEI